VSRLDSFIRRMQGQRDCLNRAAELIAAVPGPVLELGLGNGRTYDHLREILPGREIFVFDRRIAAHPASVPDAAHMILGDIRETLATADLRLGAKAALVHVDVGTGDAAANAALAAALGPLIDRLAAPGAVVASDQAIPMAGWRLLPLPEGVKAGRYHLYRVGG
jgi:hypothetical protein